MSESFEQSKLMILTVPDPRVNEGNIEENFYFHIPASYTVDDGESIYSSMNVLEVGEIGGHGGNALTRVSWEKFFIVEEWLAQTETGGWVFPNYVKKPPILSFPRQAGSVEYEDKVIQFRGAISSIRFLRKMKRDGLVGRLRIIDEQAKNITDVDLLVQLRSFRFWEPDNSPDERHYSLTFVEYREIDLVRTTGGALNTITKKRDRLGRYTGKYYTTPKMMGIRGICKIAYGKQGGYYVKRLLAANGGIPHLKSIGMKYDAKLKPGPYTFPKYTKLYIPPATGPIFPPR